MRIDIELLSDMFRQLGIPFSRLSVNSSMFVFIYPDHELFWSRFKKRYPNWRQVAVELDAEIQGRICPIFKSEEDLLMWLTRVTKLPFILCLV